MHHIQPLTAMRRPTEIMYIIGNKRTLRSIPSKWGCVIEKCINNRFEMHRTTSSEVITMVSIRPGNAS